MIRKIIQIDESKCNGCGACVQACHEGAIGLANGKAHLLRDDYCDGLGDCLPTCPTGAISFVMREAATYDTRAIQVQHVASDSLCDCPGTRPLQISRPDHIAAPEESIPSHLKQWPVQIKLAPINSPYFNGADLLIAADCTAYAYGSFHNHFIRNRITLIGCPKLDAVDYTEKLAQIIRENDIQSIIIARMEVPCCGGIEYAVKQAIAGSGKTIPCQVYTITTDGRILD